MAVHGLWYGKRASRSQGGSASGSVTGGGQRVSPPRSELSGAKPTL